jgi:ATP-dependent Lhr-like helicase
VRRRSPGDAAGRSTALEIQRDCPLDILAQQLVATWRRRAPRHRGPVGLARRAAPYLTKAPAPLRRRCSPCSRRHHHPPRPLRRPAPPRPHRTHRARGRRGARIAALTSGGAIPDKADYTVVEEPERRSVVGTVDEDFAIDSMAGDVFQLGSHAWRIRRVEQGRVRVEDAHGQPPNIPFWFGEAPSPQRRALRRAVAEPARANVDIARGLAPTRPPTPGSRIAAA